jgi:hypothetical protein
VSATLLRIFPLEEDEGGSDGREVGSRGVLRIRPSDPEELRARGFSESAHMSSTPGSSRRRARTSGLRQVASVSHVGLTRGRAGPPHPFALLWATRTPARTRRFSWPPDEHPVDRNPRIPRTPSPSPSGPARWSPLPPPASRPAWPWTEEPRGNLPGGGSPPPVAIAVDLSRSPRREPRRNPRSDRRDEGAPRVPTTRHRIAPHRRAALLPRALPAKLPPAAAPPGSAPDPPAPISDAAGRIGGAAASASPLEEGTVAVPAPVPVPVPVRRGVRPPSRGAASCSRWRGC